MATSMTTVTRPPQVRAPTRTTLQGLNDWKDLIDPEHRAPQQKTYKPRINAVKPELRETLVRYGELTQVTYDSFYGNLSSGRDFGCNQFPPKNLLEAAPLNGVKASHQGYEAIRYLYANSGQWQRVRCWMGYVAVGPPDETTGLRDCVIAWRGTVAITEWRMNVRDSIVEIYDIDKCKAQIANGFRLLYMNTPVPYYGPKQSTPQEQVSEAISEVLTKYPNEIGSFTMTGHSLGGALANVCGFDMAFRGLNDLGRGNIIPITAYTFAAPRVGDAEWAKEMDRLDVKVLRTTNKHDIVPRVPGLSKAELDGSEADIQELSTEFAGSLGNSIGILAQDFYTWWNKDKKEKYEEYGALLQLDTHDFKKVMKTGSISGAGGRNHNMEVHLHMIDPSRDMALLNKTGDVLLDDHDIPIAWHANAQTAFQGVTLMNDGTWRKFDGYDEPVEAKTQVFKDDKPPSSWSSWWSG